MAVSNQKALQWMQDHKGKVSYSMTHRDGPGSYDCSSSVYYALLSAGAVSAGWAVNTEYMHDWLIKNGYELIAENRDWNAQTGDIFIWGRKGQSSGAGGHTGMFVDSQNIIHCNYGYNGITVNNHDQIWSINGGPYFYAYRLKGGQAQATSTAKTQTASVQVGNGSLEKLAGEVISGKHGKHDERRRSLGSKYNAVQAVVNERLGAITASQSHKRLADEVLKGNLGTGAERKANLGTYYNAVQAIINKR